MAFFRDSVSLTTDYLVECAKTKVPGHYLVHKFGRNAAVANGAWELIGGTSAAPVFSASAKTVQIAAGGNAADASGGAGARQVTIQGLDDSLNRASETVDTNGESASSPTSTKFWRVDRAFVANAGAYATPYNTAAITIEDSSSTATWTIIAATEAQTQHCHWTVPTGYRAYLLSVHITIDSVQVGDARLLTREDLDTTTAPVAPRRLRHFWDGLAGPADYHPRGADVAINGPADIWMEAEGAGGATSVEASFELLVQRAG